MNKIFLSFLLLFPVMLTNAQDVRFSFIANPQLTWFSGTDDNYEANGTFPAANIGLELDIFFSESYAFSTGLTINNFRGGILYNDSIILETGDSNKILPPESRLTVGLQYVSVPLGLKFKSIEIGYTTFWVNAGVTPMINIRSRGSDDTDSFDKDDLSAETPFFNMNYFIEGGIEYSLGGNTALIGGLGYYSGFMDVTKNSDYRLTSNGFALVLGVQF